MPKMRTQLQICEERRRDIVEQCAGDVLLAEFQSDVICQDYQIFLSKGLTLKDLDRIQRRLPFVYSWNIEYDTVRTIVNRRFVVFPLIISMTETKKDVVESFEFARQYDIDIRLRGGSHNAVGYCLVTDGMIIDQSRRRCIKVDRCNRTFKAKPGVLLGPLIERLYDDHLIYSSGDCPNNGLVGYALGGGIGMVSRKYGLGCDSLLEAKVLLASGEVVKATNDNEYSDLFWTLTGGGGNNLGIVLSMKFQVFPINKVAVFEIAFPYSKFKEVFNLYQRTAPFAPRELGSEFRAINGGRGIRYSGLYLGPESELIELMQPFVDLGPSLFRTTTVPYVEAARLFAGTGRYSLFFRVANTFIPTTLLSNDAVDVITHYMGIGSGEDVLSMYPLGGAINDLSNTDTAFPYRHGNALWMLINARWNIQDQGAEHIRWLLNLYEDLSPYLPGRVYVNMPMAELPNYLRQYYSINLPKLRRIKTKYDPNNVFNYPQSIPPL